MQKLELRKVFQNPSSTRKELHLKPELILKNTTLTFPGIQLKIDF